MRKTLITTIVALSTISFPGFTGGNPVTELSISVGSIKQEGKIMAGLYNQKKDFPKDSKTFKQTSVTPAGEKQVTLKFDDVPAGEYAIAIFQDLNDNGKLDTNFFGLPTEPYAFSNNVKPKLSAPGFDACKFQFPSGAQQLISLINP